MFEIMLLILVWVIFWRMIVNNIFINLKNQ